MLHNLASQGRKAMEVIRRAGVTEKEIADSWCLISSMSREDQLKYRDEVKAVLEALTGMSPMLPGQVLAPIDVEKLEKIAECLPDLLSIKASLHDFQKLNLRDIDISIETGVDATRINRFRRHLFSVELFSKKALKSEAKTLREKLLLVQNRMLRFFVSALPIRVLHFCHNPGVDVNDVLRSQAAECIRAGLVNRLQHSPLRIELPTGCNGALAVVSEQLFVFVVADGLTSKQRIAVAHELRHVAELLIPDEVAPLQVNTERYQ